MNFKTNKKYSIKIGINTNEVVKGIFIGKKYSRHSATRYAFLSKGNWGSQPRVYFAEEVVHDPREEVFHLINYKVRSLNKLEQKFISPLIEELNKD